MLGTLVDSGEFSSEEKNVPTLMEWVWWRGGVKKTINKL